MKLNEYKELQNLIEDIGFLVQNETDDFIINIYYYLLYTYGNKTVAPIITSGVTVETIAKMLNNKYGKLWEKAKKISNNDTLSLTGYKRTETTHNDIYGYNSNTGVDDYTTTKTYDNEFENVFDNYIKALDFFSNNAYYSIISSCIANEITLPLYESEV